MPSPHPPEFRRQAVELARKGDRPLLRLAKDLGISRSCLQKWLKEDDTGAQPGAGDQLAELQRSNKQLQAENDILQRAAYLALGKRHPGAVYALIRELAAARVPVATACRLLRVSTSGYYDWLKRPESAREVRNRQLTEMIRQIHAESRGLYGSPRVHAYLQRRLGEKVNHKRIERAHARGRAAERPPRKKAPRARHPEREGVRVGGTLLPVSRRISARRSPAPSAGTRCCSSCADGARRCTSARRPRPWASGRRTRRTGSPSLPGQPFEGRRRLRQRQHVADRGGLVEPPAHGELDELLHVLGREP